MELAQDKIDLIEKVVRNDRKFAGNEDLYEDFFNETCERSFVIIKTVASEKTLEAYLRKIATTSIINVLKNSGRLRRTKDGYIPSKETLMATTEPISESTFNPIAKTGPIDYSAAEISYPVMEVTQTPEDFAIKQEILDKIADSINLIDNEDSEKQYLYLYELRYLKGLTQKEIADKLNLSQSEISKRLMKLMDRVKQSFN